MIIVTKIVGWLFVIAGAVVMLLMGQLVESCMKEPKNYRHKNTYRRD